MSFLKLLSFKDNLTYSAACVRVLFTVDIVGVVAVVGAGVHLHDDFFRFIIIQVRIIVVVIPEAKTYNTWSVTPETVSSVTLRGSCDINTS